MATPLETIAEEYSSYGTAAQKKAPPSGLPAYQTMIVDGEERRVEGYYLGGVSWITPSSIIARQNPPAPWQDNYIFKSPAEVAAMAATIEASRAKVYTPEEIESGIELTWVAEQGKPPFGPEEQASRIVTSPWEGYWKKDVQGSWQFVPSREIIRAEREGSFPEFNPYYKGALVASAGIGLESILSSAAFEPVFVPGFTLTEPQPRTELERLPASNVAAQLAAETGGIITGGQNILGVDIEVVSQAGLEKIAKDYGFVVDTATYPSGISGFTDKEGKIWISSIVPEELRLAAVTHEAIHIVSPTVSEEAVTQFAPFPSFEVQLPEVEILSPAPVEETAPTGALTTGLPSYVTEALKGTPTDFTSGLPVTGVSTIPIIAALKPSTEGILEVTLPAKTVEQITIEKIPMSEGEKQVLEFSRGFVQWNPITSPILAASSLGMSLITQGPVETAKAFGEGIIKMPETIFKEVTTSPAYGIGMIAGLAMPSIAKLLESQPITQTAELGLAQVEKIGDKTLVTQSSEIMTQVGGKQIPSVAVTKTVAEPLYIPGDMTIGEAWKVAEMMPSKGIGVGSLITEFGGKTKEAVVLEKALSLTPDEYTRTFAEAEIITKPATLFEKVKSFLTGEPYKTEEIAGKFLSKDILPEEQLHFGLQKSEYVASLGKTLTEKGKMGIAGSLVKVIREIEAPSEMTLGGAYKISTSLDVAPIVPPVFLEIAKQQAISLVKPTITEKITPLIPSVISGITGVATTKLFEPTIVKIPAEQLPAKITPEPSVSITGMAVALPKKEIPYTTIEIPKYEEKLFIPTIITEMPKVIKPTEAMPLYEEIKTIVKPMVKMPSIVEVPKMEITPSVVPRVEEKITMPSIFEKMKVVPYKEELLPEKIKPLEITEVVAPTYKETKIATEPIFEAPKMVEEVKIEKLVEPEKIMPSIFEAPTKIKKEEIIGLPKIIEEPFEKIKIFEQKKELQMPPSPYGEPTMMPSIFGMPKKKVIEEETYIHPFVTEQITQQIGEISAPSIEQFLAIPSIGMPSIAEEQKKEEIGIGILGITPQKEITKSIFETPLTGLTPLETQITVPEIITTPITIPITTPIQTPFLTTTPTTVTTTVPTTITTTTPRAPTTPPTTWTLFPPIPILPFDFGGGAGLRVPPKRKAFRRKYQYAPTVVGIEMGRYIRKAPKQMGVEALGIRYPVAQKGVNFNVPLLGQFNVSLRGGIRQKKPKKKRKSLITSAMDNVFRRLGV